MYDVAQPSFNEEAAPRWWRKQGQVVEEDEEPLVFPKIVDAALVPADDIQFPTAEDDIDIQAFAPPIAPAQASPRTPAILGVPSPQASPPASPLASPSPPLSLLPDESHPRRSSKTNQGVLPLHLAGMMMAATEETGVDDPKTYKP